MSATEQASRVTPPIAAADATGLTGVMRISVSTTGSSVALPARGSAQRPGDKSALAGRYVRAAAVGCNIQYAFGYGSAPTITFNATSALGTGDATAGATLFNGLPEHFMIPREATHLAWDADGSGYLEFYVSDQPVV